METPISLAEWIAGLRADLAEAILWQEERERRSLVEKVPLKVPRLRLDTIKLEVEVRTTQETAGKAGLKFWVITGDAEKKLSQGSTQRITLSLVPQAEVHLGDDAGFMEDDIRT